MTDLQTAISKIRAACKRVLEQNKRAGHSMMEPSDFELASAKGWLAILEHWHDPQCKCESCAALIEMAYSLEER